MSKSYRQFTEEAEQLDELVGDAIKFPFKLAGGAVKGVYNMAKRAWEAGKKELGVSKGSDEKGFSKAS